MGQKYGQHFLHDQGVLHRISCLVDAFTPSSVIEIGPGKGALTRRLLHKSYRLTLSEIDRTLQPLLESLLQDTDTRILRGDILHQSTTIDEQGMLQLAEESSPATQTLIVGNLPYYITSPILRKFFFELSSLLGGVFLVQKEVADKISYDAPKKSYLWRLLNLGYEVRYVCTVKAGSFSPPPKVASAVITLHKLASPRLEKSKTTRLLTFLDLASPFKRKTLGKIQKMQVEKFDQAKLSIPKKLLGKRLEELGWEEMKEILND